MNCTGKLFDLAPDGLGLIADRTGNRIWAFVLDELADPPEALRADFLAWEGKSVIFHVSYGKVRTLSEAMRATAGGPAV